MDYRDDWRRFPRDRFRHGEAVGPRGGRGFDERQAYAQEGFRGRYPDPRSRRVAGPLFGPDYGNMDDPDITGSSSEVDDYAFFNAGNYGRHYGGGFGSAQPTRPMEDRNLQEDRWYGIDRAVAQPSPAAGSHRGRGPKGYKRSDERILDEAHERLTEDHHIDASDIEVLVSAGEVTLNGTVVSREAKRHAEDIVDHILGVVHTQNNLRVGKPEAPSVWAKEAEGVMQAAGQVKKLRPR